MTPDVEGDFVTAAQRVLADDGRAYALQPWQIAYLFALVEGRPPIVPPGCGVGKGWLDARLQERIGVPVVRMLSTSHLAASEVEALRALFAAAWPDGQFTDIDFMHATGGMHWLSQLDGRVVSHASVVERTLYLDQHATRTGYVEAVATAPSAQGRGYGSTVMRSVAEYIRSTFELGALSTGRHSFYERLGWSRWRGPTSVLAGERRIQTDEDHGGILVLVTPTSPALDLDGPITCDWRDGDVW